MGLDGQTTEANYGPENINMDGKRISVVRVRMGTRNSMACVTLFGGYSGQHVTRHGTIQPKENAYF